MNAKLLICAALLGALSASATTEPIAQWNMDEVVDGMVPDRSGNGRDLTVGPDCSLSNSVFKAGSTFSTLYFPGTDGAWATFDCPALVDRTVVFWIYREASGWDPLDPSIPYLVVGLSSMQIQCHHNDATPLLEPWYSGNSGGAAFYPYASQVLSRGTWHQFVVSIKSTGATGGEGADAWLEASQDFYVDGVKKSDTSQSGLHFPAELARAGTAIVGNNGTPGERPIFGHLGEMRVYDRALSADEIRELYEEKIRGLAVVNWKMDEVRTDASGRRYVPDDGFSGTRLYLGDSVTLADGVDGKALRFNPTDAKTLDKSWSSSDPLQFNGRLSKCTFALWLNVATDITNTTQLVNPEGNVNQIPFIWSVKDNYTRLMINSNGQLARDQTGLHYFQGGDFYSYFENGYREKGDWTHITVVMSYEPDGKGTYDSSYRIYVDGEDAGVSNAAAEQAAGNMLTGDCVMRIGASVDGDGSNNCRAFTGLVDDFRIYAGALTADEIRELYGQSARAKAGEDFTAANETVTLRGSVVSRSGAPCSTVFKGDVRWSLVCAPDGAMGVSIENPAALSTRVTLPVLGSYVFRLSLGGLDGAGYDEVTVTRVESVADNQPPTVALAATAAVPFMGRAAIAATVADPDAKPGTLRASWRKISGPGGVWFEPSDAAATEVSFSATGDYVLRCTAEDGQDAAFADVTVTVSGGSFNPESLKDGLFAYYRFNGGSCTSEVPGGVTAALANYRAGTWSQHFVPALDGEGYRGEGRDDYANLGIGGDQENLDWTTPDKPWLTYSCWVYHDPSLKPGGCWPYWPSIVSKRSAYDLLYLVTPEGGGTGGFWTFQAWGGFKWQPPARPLANRWAHVVVQFDRRAELHDEDDLTEVWVDGVLLQHTADLPGQKKSRTTTCDVAIGGCNYGRISVPEDYGFHPDYCYSNETYGVMSRSFPGTIDDFRCYNRKLTPEEIRYLAEHPVVGANRGPSVGVAQDAYKCTRGETVAVQVTANGDGVGYDSRLAYSWSVLSGDPAKLAFSDKSARSPTVKARKKGAWTIQLKVTDGERTTYSDVIAFEAEASGMTLYIR